MENPYQAPKTNFVLETDENNSGGGKSIVPPPGIAGWGWGPFLWNWIWAIFNKTWIGLICLIPYVNLVGIIYLGLKGRELAWQNKRWESVEHFQRVQRAWSMRGLIVIVFVFVLGIVAAIAIPMFVAARQG